MTKRLLAGACAYALLAAAPRLHAQTASTASPGQPITTLKTSAAVVPQEQAQARPTDKKRSPWMVLPILSSNPKLGTEFGGLGAYLRTFDPKSQVSMFGAMFEYTSTHSMIGAAFARTSFGADHHRLEGILGFGIVHNEYEDYLDTGKPFKTTDDIRGVAGRYFYRVKGNWFVGGQMAFANYRISGETDLDDKILNIIGLTGVKTGGIGLALMHDSRDNQDMPVKGWYAALNNLANREWLGAGDDYDAYRLDIKWFKQHGGGHVFAVRQSNQFTVHAPMSADASIQLRGYKFGQYLGEHMSSLEGEERFRLSRRWGATIFAGVGCLYGERQSCSDSDSLYPSYGAGFQFVVKPEDHMLLNLEYAHGTQSNYGIYLKLGYAW
jgi:hypothetical protein